MYKILKDKGSNRNITLKNVDTNASVVLGRMTLDILRILETNEGLTFDKDGTHVTDAWEIPVNTETAEALQKLALKVSKPIRKRTQPQQTSAEIRKARHKAIDALDVLMGIATYD